MTISFVVVYLLTRSLSFATYQHSTINQLIASFLLGAYAYTCVRNPKLGWFILVGELILGGAGHFFELNGLLLRTWLLFIFVTTWLWTSFKSRNFTLPNRSIWLTLLSLACVTLFAGLNGFYHNHNLTVIVQDAITFGFLGLLLPTVGTWRDYVPQTLALGKAWLIGSSIFSALTLFIYSSGLGHLPDTYYHWFRNIASGKITDLGNHFFRIVLPEHIIIVPLILLITAWLIRSPLDKKLWFWQMCALFILTLNFSRIYFIGLVVGMLVLAYKQNFRVYWRVTTLSLLTLCALFFTTHLISSRGHDTGLALFGVRLGGSVAPAADVSGAIRLAILPDALQQIKHNPLLGSGLGATVTYLDPATQKSVTRTQFDWGYLELLAEFGVLGVCLFIFFGFKLITQIVSFLKIHNKKSPIAIGLLAGTISLVLINTTTPALFHGFGILYFVFILSVTNHASAELPAELVHSA